MDEFRLEQNDGCSWLSVDRPAKRNAMSLDMWRALPQLIKAFVEDTSAKVLVLQGRHERVFSAGADIEEIEQHSHYSRSAAIFMDAVEAGADAIAHCPKPTIAMIRGDCIGGGVELAMACDIRFASCLSRFSVPPAKLGVLYSFGSTKRLMALVGPGRAKDLLFSGRMFDAAEAAAMGLVDRLFAPEEICAATVAYAHLLTQRSQASIKGAKKMVSAVENGLAAEDAEIRKLRIATFLGEDLKEGVRAFLEKRAPKFR